MKKSLTRALIGTVAAGVTLLSLSTTSWSMGPGGGMDHDPARIIVHMTDRLELTEDQQSRVQALLESSSEETAVDRDRLKVLRKQIRGQRGSFNAGEVQTIADEIGEITSRMVFRATSTHAEIYQLLSDEQKTEMEAMMEKRDERRSKWRRDGKPSRE